MGNYIIPEGFDLDPATGLYKSESIVMDESGAAFRLLVSFDDVSGTYFQELIPVEQSAPQSVQQRPVQSPVQRTQQRPQQRVQNRSSKRSFQSTSMRMPLSASGRRAKKAHRRKLLMIGIPAAVLALGVLFLIILLAGADPAVEPLSEEDFTTYETEYFSQPVPSTTISGYEFEGGLTEGGIIR